ITGELKTNRIQLVVEDNGLGFSIDEVLTRSHTMGRRHYGVVVMRERAELINAELRINSTLGKGTLVELLLSDVLHQQWE
nr:hypothetical protein [Chloroflexota bacterium]